MLVCPQCHFHNPITNNFCQKCGTSLTQKTCPTCQTKVPLDALDCQSCGEMVGTVWLAVISGAPVATFTQQLAPDVAPLTSTPVFISLDTAPTSTQELPAVSDADEVEPFSASTLELDNIEPTAETAPPEVETETSQEPSDFEDEETTEILNLPVVTTGQPTVFQPRFAEPEEFQLPQTEPVESSETEPVSSPTSPSIFKQEFLDPQRRYKLLEVLPPQDAAESEIEVRVLDCKPYLLSPLAAVVASRVSLNPSQQLANSVEVWAIPKLAQSYLSALPQLQRNLPVIHDAWTEEEITVLVLQDRSHLPLLSQEWGNDKNGPINLLGWLYKMMDLWEALSPQHRQSLLEIQNLRVDEGGNLCLQRLYPEKPHTVLTLQELGGLWEWFFQQSQRTQLGSVTALLADMTEGKVQDIDTLREGLDAISDELEHTAPLAIDPDDDLDDDMPTIILPLQVVSIESAGATDIGKQRDHNEDFFGIETLINTLQTPQKRNIHARCLYILCDGMGGHAGGEVASAMATETLRGYFQGQCGDQFPSEAEISLGVKQANQAIYEINQKEMSSGSGRMGTTLVLALVQDSQLAVAHVGDSRLYSLTRRHGLKQLTVDHEVGQREIKRGVDAQTAYSRPDAYQLTQALGPRGEDFVHPDVQFFELQEDTLLLLASDGLTDNDLLEQHWQTHLQPYLSPDTSLETGVRQLIDLANQYNGHDNITAILIRARVQPGKA
ncbi:serine/threonine phosphatase [Ancylothrix sp. C2]|uniref:serine/threonine phosphatase n=1 Tax=Ancylothrix sp. D3o TaxID=2953691 RepID=UPI0021BBABCF|nr:serine/threonine phosphatase [Ancylothrix sp. D3o]MCT7950937.1 serine/threonine phosphatase [Ancylothrix sp. D3o]